MSQVDYNTPQHQSNRRNVDPKESFLMRLVLRTGIAKDKKQANVILLAIAGVFFLITFIILFANGIFSSESKINKDINYKEYTGGEYIQEE